MDTRIEVIGIDHGWSMMKSVSEVFVTGIKEITTIPALYKDTLEYKGKYYRVGTNRQEVKDTKTEDDSFKLLTYAAIAKELKRRGLKESKVFLAVGLPLTRFGVEKKPFINYLMEEKDVTFIFEQVSYHIVIDNVVVFPQCYAAVADRLPSFAKKTLVVDIDERYQKIIKEEITSFVERVYNSIREYGYNLATTPIVFVGGGAVVMKNFGSYNQKNISYILDVKANAKGYEYLATMAMRNMVKRA